MTATRSSGFDWVMIKNIALGTLKLKLDEFWELTPSEFEDLYRAYKYEEERQTKRQMEIQAWFTAHLMNISGKVLKEPVSPADLLPDERAEKPKRTAEDLKRELMEVSERIDKTIQGK